MWALSDSAAARVALDAQGGARITAVALGKVGAVIANGVRYEVIACGNPYGLSEVDVVRRWTIWRCCA